MGGERVCEPARRGRERENRRESVQIEESSWTVFSDERVCDIERRARVRECSGLIPDKANRSTLRLSISHALSPSMTDERAGGMKRAENIPLFAHCEGLKETFRGEWGAYWGVGYH